MSGRIHADGSVTAYLAGRPVRLKLTLRALADLEARFGADLEKRDGEESLRTRLNTLRSQDVIFLLGALIEGGGADQGVVDPGAAAPEEAADAIRLAFAANARDAEDEV